MRIPDMSTPTYLRTAEVADILHVPPKIVSRWAKEGKLPSVTTPGGRRRYPEAKIRELAAEPLACPKCGSTEATATYTANVRVVIQDGQLHRVSVDDESADRCRLLRCLGCGVERTPGMARLRTPDGRWVAAMLKLLGDANGWPKWHIGSG
jgi:excisionase family DNA binding protein